MKLLRNLLALGLAAAACTQAQATIIEYTFAGSIGRVENWPTAVVSIGDPVTATLLWETQHLDSNPASDVGRYLFLPVLSPEARLEHPEASGVISLRIPGLASTEGSTIMTVTNGPEDSIGVRGESLPGRFVNLLLSDPSGTAINSDAMPSAINLADWPIARLWIQGSSLIDGTIPLIEVTLTRPAPPSVPDATNSGMLLLFTLAGVAFVARPKRI